MPAHELKVPDRPEFMVGSTLYGMAGVLSIICWTVDVLCASSAIGIRAECSVRVNMVKVCSSTSSHIRPQRTQKLLKACHLYRSILS